MNTQTSWFGSAALYECIVRHVRTRPLRHAFTYRTYQWFVDLDDLPCPPTWLKPFAGFHAGDHLGNKNVSIRQNVDTFLAARGINLDGGRVTMLTQARVLGYSYHPITIYWCRHSSGALECILAELHNTYGERHCYVIRPDLQGRANVPKEMYVSPFFPVDGSYNVSIPEPDDRLRVSVKLERDDHRPFIATLQGRQLPATTSNVLRLALRHPWATALVSAQIRFQGTYLHIRGLPLEPRHPHQQQEHV